MRIMAIDPGLTCGFAINELCCDVFPTHAWQEKAKHYSIFSTIANYKPNIIVCESFLFRSNMSKVDYIAPEMIGVIKLYVDRENIDLVMQNPSDKSYWTSEKLKKLGLWIPGQPHAMDALRHLKQYEMRNGLFDIILLK